MAFQQPIQRPSRRAATPPPIATTSQAPRRPEPVEESQEWVLFSPLSPQQDQNNDATAAVQTATPITPRTFPKSRLSDFGSLDTAAVSDRHRDQALVDEEEDDDDDDEADSLDDGLHAFNEPASASNPSAHHCLDSSIAEPVLPAHDGLGGFTGSNVSYQQQLWQYEKYNPQRAARRSSSLRRSSVQRRLDALNDEQQREAPKDATEERNRRIEKWRMDQSRAIVDEIERETRRRRRRSKLSQSSLPPKNFPTSEMKENIAPTSTDPVSSASQPIESESFWARTRRVIRDIIGIDDATLSYIFGEGLPGSAKIDDSSARPKPLSSAQMIKHAERTVPDSLEIIKSSNTWEENLLARIARELGSLVHQLSDHPPTTFSTYMKVQEVVPYAGLPTPTDISTPAGFFSFAPPPTTTSARQPNPRFRHRRRLSAARTDPSLFGIEEESAADDVVEDDNDLTPQQTRGSAVSQEDEPSRLERERSYWEKDLDVKMVFGYLKSRLGGRISPTETDAPTSTSRLSTHATGPTFSSTATSTGPDTLRRAALIRHHHPLVSRNLNTLWAPNQTHATSQPTQLPATPLSPILGRRNSSVIDDAASSCASQSTKKSKTHHSGSFSLSSSRNYWDIGGPSWGEV